MTESDRVFLLVLNVKVLAWSTFFHPLLRPIIKYRKLSNYGNLGMAIERVNSQHLCSTEGFKIFENTFCSNFCGLEEHAIYQNIFSSLSQVKDSPPLDKLVIILGIEIFLFPHLMPRRPPSRAWCPGNTRVTPDLH